MFKIKTMNSISPMGVEVLQKHGCTVGADVENPQALLIRSADLHGSSFRGTRSVAVQRGVDQDDVVVLGRAGAPLLVLVDKPRDVLAPDGTVQRQDAADVEAGRLFQDCLDIIAVFANYVCIVSSGVRKPVSVEIHFIGENGTVQSAESAEGIR